MKTTLAFLFSSLVLIACSGEVVDSISSDELGSKKGAACGQSTCGQGETCCNESCGICTKPGEACAAVLCAPVPTPLPPPVVKCGQNTCDQGEVCCNESCGTCTKPDGACLQLFCTPEPGPGPTTCPAPVYTQQACAQVVVWGKEAKTGACCMYGNPCSVPPGIVAPLFYSEAECNGKEARGTTN